MSITQSLAHGLNVLLLYETRTPSFTAPEISKRLGYSKSKTYRLIRTLIKYGFLQEQDGTSRYSLGLNAFHLGLVAQQQFNITSIARPLMKELSKTTKETVVLTAIHGTRGIVLDRVESDEPIRYTIFYPGASIPLHAGASSKILMAYLPEKDWDEIISQEGLKRYTQNTMTDRDGLKAHLREIRNRGFCVSDQEVDRDVRAVAAPIFNSRGELVAGLSVAGPAYRIHKRKMNSWGRLVVKYAGEISSRLAWEVI